MRKSLPGSIVTCLSDFWRYSRPEVLSDQTSLLLQVDKDVLNISKMSLNSCTRRVCKKEFKAPNWIRVTSIPVLSYGLQTSQFSTFDDLDIEFILFYYRICPSVDYSAHVLLFACKSRVKQTTMH